MLVDPSLKVTQMAIRSLLIIPLLLTTSSLLAADDYKLGPDSMRREGVPQGSIIHGTWKSDKVFPGTEREYWIYVPAQYDGKSEACVMVFNDGRTYVNDKGAFRVPVVTFSKNKKPKMASIAACQLVAS